MNAWRGYVVGSVLVAALMMVGLVTAPPAAAHHAIQAEYEMSKTGSFTGTLTRFAMINPHVRWFFEETKADGTKWARPTTSPSRRRRTAPTSAGSAR